MAASGEPLSSLTPRLVRYIQEMTGHGELYSASAIVRDLMLCAEAMTQMRVDAPKGQDEVSKKRAIVRGVQLQPNQRKHYSSTPGNGMSSTLTL